MTTQNQNNEVVTKIKEDTYLEKLFKVQPFSHLKYGISCKIKYLKALSDITSSKKFLFYETLATLNKKGIPSHLVRSVMTALITSPYSCYCFCKTPSRFKAKIFMACDPESKLNGILNPQNLGKEFFDADKVISGEIQFPRKDFDSRIASYSLQIDVITEEEANYVRDKLIKYLYIDNIESLFAVYENEIMPNIEDLSNVSVKAKNIASLVRIYYTLSTLIEKLAMKGLNGKWIVPSAEELAFSLLVKEQDIKTYLDFLCHTELLVKSPFNQSYRLSLSDKEFQIIQDDINNDLKEGRNIDEETPKNSLFKYYDSGMVNINNIDKFLVVTNKIEQSASEAVILASNVRKFANELIEIKEAVDKQNSVIERGREALASQQKTCNRLDNENKKNRLVINDLEKYCNSLKNVAYNTISNFEDELESQVIRVFTQEMKSYIQSLNGRTLSRDTISLIVSRINDFERDVTKKFGALDIILNENLLIQTKKRKK